MNNVLAVNNEPPTRQMFFDSAARSSGFAGGSNEREQWVYCGRRYVIDNIFFIVRQWLTNLKEWDAVFIARGPVETEEPLIYAQGDLVYQSYDLAFIYVTGTKPGHSTRIRIEPQYIDMIKVALDNEDEIRVVFYLQVGPAKE
jgi:hypothetical protein